MRTIQVLVLLAASALFSACSMVTVKSDYDKRKDFSQYKSYKWSQEETPGDALMENPALKNRIIEAVNQNLQGKGFAYQDSDEADLSIAIHATVEEKMKVQDWESWDRSGWYNPWWGPYGGNVEVSNYSEGTLVVDIVDVAAKELVWRGLGTKTIQEFVKDQSKVDEIMGKLLSEFPPEHK